MVKISGANKISVLQDLILFGTNTERDLVHSMEKTSKALLVPKYQGMGYVLRECRRQFMPKKTQTIITILYQEIQWSPGALQIN